MKDQKQILKEYDARMRPCGDCKGRGLLIGLACGIWPCPCGLLKGASLKEMALLLHGLLDRADKKK